MWILAVASFRLPCCTHAQNKLHNCRLPEQLWRSTCLGHARLVERSASLSFLQCFSRAQIRHEIECKSQFCLPAPDGKKHKRSKQLIDFAVSPLHTWMKFVTVHALWAISCTVVCVRRKVEILQRETRRECAWMKNSVAWHGILHKHHVQNAMRSTTTGRKTNFGLIEMFVSASPSEKRWPGEKMHRSAE